MQRPKSRRHQKAAQARWRAAAERAQAERDLGIPDREAPQDCRDTFILDLTRWGGKRLRIEPRVGYISCRVYDDETGELKECVALKTALHNIANKLPRTLSLRHCMR